MRRLLLLLAGLVAAVAAASTPATTTAGVPLSPKLRADLAALVSGAAGLDPRIPGLTAGYQPGEIPYFAVLAEPNDAAHRAQITALGARVLREYASVDAFALASDAATVSEVAALPWVDWLAPVEVVVALGHQHEVGEPRDTPSDVGAPPFWNAGVTGTGVRIAVLDTGLDPSHQDLDDLDFRHWTPSLASPLVSPPKVVDSRNFVGSSLSSSCESTGSTDGHGHGTHVAGIATGTGEGAPLDSDDGKHAGIAPGAELAVGKVLTDAGAGLNSDLVTAMEWAALPAGTRVPGCALATAIGADIVNLSLGSEARPTRLNSGADVDFVSLALNRLAVRFGTLFVAAAGNSGPYIGSVLEAPGSAAQALSVAAAAKDFDVNHDDTLSGDTCAGWRHPRSTSFGDNDCRAGAGDQPPSAASFSSRGPSGDVWLRPDLAAPGYNIVSAQAATGAALAFNDINRNTRADPLYATASGTSMATPATAGSAALLLDAYRRAYGADPTGASGVTGLKAPKYALLRAALMNSAGGDLFESRWILTTDAAMRLDCPATPDPLFPTFCGFGKIFTDLLADAFGSFTLYEVRNRVADPFVGPLAEGAGKLQIAAAIAALRSGVVIYSAASGTGAAAGTGHRDLQGSWQVGAIAPGSTQTQRFVLRTAPAAGPVSVSFSFEPGRPSDGSTAIPAGTGPGAWAVKLPGTTSVGRDRSRIVQFAVAVPSSAPAGTYTGVVVARVSSGQTVRIPVFASVPLHDPNPAAGNAPGPQARITSARDVFAKDDTTWPSLAGTAGTGANADWLVHPVTLANGLSEARFSIYDSDARNETYDLYLYDARFDLIATTHPFLAPGVTNRPANDARGPSTQSVPQVLSLAGPAAGRYYLAVNRARVGGTSTGDFGSFVLTLDEVRAAGAGAAACEDEDDELAVSGPAAAAAGGTVDYTITYSNRGPSDDDGCELEDELDEETHFVSASSGGSYDPATHSVRWKVGKLPAGSTTSFRVTARIAPATPPGAVLVNRAVLGGAGALFPKVALAQTLVLPG